MPETEAAQHELWMRLLATVPLAVLIVVGATALNYLLRRALRLLGERARFTPASLQPVSKVLEWCLWGVTLVLLCTVFGFDLGGLWTVLTTILALIAIGFVAVWSVLSNSMCALLLVLFRPFAVGDEIEFAGEAVKGRVVDFNFLFTTLDCGDGSVLQVPNNLFFQKSVRRRRGSHSKPLAEQLHESGEGTV